MSIKKQSDNTSNIIKDIRSTKKEISIDFSSFSLVIDSDTYLEGFYYPGKELSEEEIKKLESKVKTKSCRKYLHTILSRRMYTEKELDDKIKSKYKFSKEEREKIVSELKEYSLVDDESYARSFIEDKKENGYGEKYLLNELKKRGINETLIKKFIKEGLFVTDKAILKAFVEKQDRILKNLTIEKKKEKIFSTLLRRGFERSEIKAELDNYFSSMSDEDKEKERKERADLLKKEAQKCYNSIQRKEKGKQKDTFYRRLLSLGFTYEEIRNIIEREEYKLQ